MELEIGEMASSIRPYPLNVLGIASKAFTMINPWDSGDLTGR